jgi:hypothetical protein
MIRCRTNIPPTLRKRAAVAASKVQDPNTAIATLEPIQMLRTIITNVFITSSPCAGYIIDIKVTQNRLNFSTT